MKTNDGKNETMITFDAARSQSLKEILDNANLMNADEYRLNLIITYIMDGMLVLAWLLLMYLVIADTVPLLALIICALVFSAMSWWNHHTL